MHIDSSNLPLQPLKTVLRRSTVRHRASEHRHCPSNGRSLVPAFLHHANVSSLEHWEAAFSSLFQPTRSLLCITTPHRIPASGTQTPPWPTHRERYRAKVSRHSVRAGVKSAGCGHWQAGGSRHGSGGAIRGHSQRRVETGYSGVRKAHLKARVE